MKSISATSVVFSLHPHKVTCLDEQYGVLKHEWVVNEFIPFWSKWLKAVGVTYTAQKWDCDKYTRAFLSQMHIACFQSRSPYTALCGFLSTTDNGGHALVIVKTEQGWFEIEPQADTIVPFKRENPETVRYIIF